MSITALSVALAVTTEVSASGEIRMPRESSRAVRFELSATTEELSFCASRTVSAPFVNIESREPGRLDILVCATA